jgi:hypothetical protein
LANGISISRQSVCWWSANHRCTKVFDSPWGCTNYDLGATENILRILKDLHVLVLNALVQFNATSQISTRLCSIWEITSRLAVPQPEISRCPFISPISSGLSSLP